MAPLLLALLWEESKSLYNTDRSSERPIRIEFIADELPLCVTIELLVVNDMKRF